MHIFCLISRHIWAQYLDWKARMDPLEDFINERRTPCRLLDMFDVSVSSCNTYRKILLELKTLAHFVVFHLGTQVEILTE